MLLGIRESPTLGSGNCLKDVCSSKIPVKLAIAIHILSSYSGNDSICEMVMTQCCIFPCVLFTLNYVISSILRT